MEHIRKSMLYDKLCEVRIGIVNDSGTFNIEETPLLNDPKFKIVYVGKSEEYERPTLLHMKQSAETDDPETRYFYFHTKGIQWFGTEIESFIIDWIQLMIYWNIEKWHDAFYLLNKYDTYGCNYHDGTKHPKHYSGNFFWTTTHHLKMLPNEIGPDYNATEFWLCSNGLFNGSPNIYNAFTAVFKDGFCHYNCHFPESMYRK